MPLDLFEKYIAPPEPALEDEAASDEKVWPKFYENHNWILKGVLYLCLDMPLACLSDILEYPWSYCKQKTEKIWIWNFLSFQWFFVIEIITQGKLNNYSIANANFMEFCHIKCEFNDFYEDWKWLSIGIIIWQVFPWECLA